MTHQGRNLRGWLLDLDGILVANDRLNARCWKTTFDEVLERHGPAGRRPFSLVDDYRRFVDGRPTADGVRAFLAARGIDLPEGEPGDRPGTPTVRGVAARNDELVEHAVRAEGLQPIEPSLELLQRLRGRGARTAVVSSSGDARAVLEEVGAAELVEVVVDGEVAAAHRLAGKPAADTLTFAADRLGLPPAACAVVDDGPAGIAAGRAAGLGLVVGMDRDGYADLLREQGADVVVATVEDLPTLERRAAPA